MAEDQNARFRARPGQEIPGESFGEAFKRHKAAGRANFPWKGETYSTETREERTQKAYSDTSRRQEGAAAKASNRPGRVRPDETAVSSMDLRDIPGLIARGMSEGADRVPAGRGAGAAFVGAALPRLLVPTAKTLRDHPSITPERRQMLKEMEDYINVLNQADRPARNPAMRAMEERVEPPFKKGGKVRAYAKGGSVKGAGCEQRGLRKCKVY